MTRHWKGAFVLALLVAIAFGGAVAMHWPMVAVCVLLAALVAGFILGTAWMRPRAETEHKDPPAPEDRFTSMRQR